MSLKVFGNANIEKSRWIVLGITLFFVMFLMIDVHAHAFDREALKKEIKQELKKELKEEGGPLAGLKDNLTFSGAVEVAYQYVDHQDRTDKDSDSTSNLVVGKVELGVEALINEWTAANVVLVAEDVGVGGNDNVFVDEALITLQNEKKFPIYFVLGKRGQPFGQFYTHTISDPITKGAYEVAATGVTVGLAPGFYDLDLSLTVYKGEYVMDQVSDIGSAPGRNAGYTADDDVSSCIVALSLSPFEGFTLGVAYDSEPGHDSRNNTLNAFAQFSRFGLTLEAEYFTATKRETFTADGRSYKEKAWTVGVAYQVLEPLEVALRYEKFNNGRPKATGDFNYTYAIGINYQILENVCLMAEYRRLQEKDGGDNTYLKGVNEFCFQVAAEW